MAIWRQMTEATRKQKRQANRPEGQTNSPEGQTNRPEGLRTRGSPENITEAAVACRFCLVFLLSSFRLSNLALVFESRACFRILNLILPVGASSDFRIAAVEFPRHSALSIPGLRVSGCQTFPPVEPSSDQVSALVDPIRPTVWSVNPALVKFVN